MAVDAGEFRRALESVCDIFKIPSLYSEQEKCLEALFKGKDVYASLPTGYGKSLIFYAAPIVADELFSYYCRERKWKILYRRLRLQSPRKWKPVKSRYFSDVMMYEK